MPLDPSRSTPRGFWRFAAEYLLAARAVHAELDAGASLLYPTLHLYGLALELALKAFLLKRGVPLKDVRKLWHNLVDAMTLARRRRLGRLVKLSRQDMSTIRALNVTYSSTELRYKRTGSTKVPRDVAGVARIAERLVVGVETYCAGYTGQLARLQRRRRHAVPPAAPAARVARR